MSETIETPIDEATSKSTGLAVNLDVQELTYLLDLLAPKLVRALGEEVYVVDLFIKLHAGLVTLVPQIEGEETMPAGGESYDKAAHVPDRASGNMTKQAGGHAEPATKKMLREKTVAQVMGEAPHMPAPRDTETAKRGGHGTMGVQENAGS